MLKILDCVSLLSKFNRNKQKTQKTFPLTWVTVGAGGGQDGKWSHFPPFFITSLMQGANTTNPPRPASPVECQC